MKIIYKRNGKDETKTFKGRIKMKEVYDYRGNILQTNDIVKLRYTNDIYEITAIVYAGRTHGIYNKIQIRNMINGNVTFGFPDSFEKIGHQYTESEWEENKNRLYRSQMFGVDTSYRYGYYKKPETRSMPTIKDVIINPPATVVIWDDGTKTVVKCGEGETFDPEKGLAMAISKKVLGNKYMWHGKFNKWLKKYNKEDDQNG